MSSRETLQNWATEQGVTVTELLGYFLHLENYLDNRPLAALGWQIFTGEKLSQKPEITVSEAIWLIEKANLSQSTYLEIRLRLLDRIVMPPVMKVRAESKEHRPYLTEYRHGVRAQLNQCLALTLYEHLQILDLSGLDRESL